MAVYRPTYKDLKTGEVKQAAVWWYDFRFDGRRIQEPSKSTRKTVAVEAEKARRRELEKGFNAIEDTRSTRIRPIIVLADEFLASYRLRNPRSATFADFALGHIKRVIGKTMAIDVSEDTITSYRRPGSRKERRRSRSMRRSRSFSAYSGTRATCCD